MNNKHYVHYGWQQYIKECTKTLYFLGCHKKSWETKAKDGNQDQDTKTETTPTVFVAILRNKTKSSLVIQTINTRQQTRQADGQQQQQTDGQTK